MEFWIAMFSICNCIKQYQILIIQRIMYPTLNISYAETVQQDTIIDFYKRQLHSLKERQQDYVILQNEMAKIEAKYQLIKAQKQRIEKQNKNKLQINQEFILELKTQGDNLRLQSSRIIAKMQPLRREIFLNARVAQQRQSEATALLRINVKSNQDNIKIHQQNKIFCLRVSQILMQRQKLDSQKQRLSRQLQLSLNEHSILQKQSIEFEESNKKLLTILNFAEKDNLELIQQSKIRQRTLQLLFSKLQNIDSQVQNIIQKKNILKQQIKRGQQYLLSLTNDAEILAIKNQQQIHKMGVYESQLQLLESDYKAALSQKQSLQKEQISSSLQNKALQGEIAQILLTIAQAEKQHQCLKQEVEIYIADYQLASNKLLGRREINYNILNLVNTGLQQTSYYIDHLR